MWHHKFVTSRSDDVISFCNIIFRGWHQFVRSQEKAPRNVWLHKKLRTWIWHHRRWHHKLWHHQFCWWHHQFGWWHHQFGWWHHQFDWWHHQIGWWHHRFWWHEMESVTPLMSCPLLMSAYLLDKEVQKCMVLTLRVGKFPRTSLKER